MLEEKRYSFAELQKIIGGTDKRGLEKKLKGYGVDYRTEGWGKELSFIIEKINDPFKVYCITELEFRPQSDFNHLKHFFYHFFCDDFFMSKHDKWKEKVMRNSGYYISRQTIAKYEKQLREKRVVAYDTNDDSMVYYFAYKDYVRITDKETYKKAWHYYWGLKERGVDYLTAKWWLILRYGGLPAKHGTDVVNACYVEPMNRLISIIRKGIEDELSQKGITLNSDFDIMEEAISQKKELIKYYDFIKENIAQKGQTLNT